MSEWKSGQIILGEYAIEKELGRGGMGCVWLVKSNSTGRRFAVKQTLLKEDKHRKAFLAELQTWIDLPEHPNIVPCRFFRTVGDEIVIFADYIEGGSLADWIAKGKLTGLEQILDVAIQFAWGMHAIHERGLVHQDVKPGNVLMTPEGVPMVTDFGLARARLGAPDGAFVSPGLPPRPGHQSVLVSSGGMTPAYASPEQRNGEPLSRKTDIWSWGVSVLDMFMGGVSCPHGGHIAAEVLESFVVNEQECDECSEMPVEVVDVLRRCFAREAADRWVAMSTAANALVAVFPTEIGHPYSRSAPSVTEQVANWPYVRRDYTGGNWRDPHHWLAVANAMKVGDMAQMSDAPQAVHQSRSASAVSDLAKYQEASCVLARLADAGNKNAARCACDLYFEMAHIHSELNDLHGMLASYDQCVHYAEALRGASHVAGYADYMLAHALDQKALGHRRSGQVATALENYHQSIGHWQHLLSSHPAHPPFDFGYAHTLTNAAIYDRA
jgi:serine/threonine protein kinase